MKLQTLETHMLLPSMTVYKIHQVVWDMYSGLESTHERDFIYSFVESGNNYIITLRTNSINHASDKFKKHLVDTHYDIAKDDIYYFNIRVVPVVRSEHRIIDLPKNKDAEIWFSKKASSHGFTVTEFDTCISQARIFYGAKNRKITLNDTFIQGKLSVTDPDSFIYSMINGVGRHKGFGYGMMNIKQLT